MIRIGTLINTFLLYDGDVMGKKWLFCSTNVEKKISSAKKYRIRNMKGRRITAEVFTGEISYDR